MTGVNTADIIDIDEAGFKLEHQNRKHGKTVSALRCDQQGVYGWGKTQSTTRDLGGRRQYDAVARDMDGRGDNHYKGRLL